MYIKKSLYLVNRLDFLGLAFVQRGSNRTFYRSRKCHIRFFVAFVRPYRYIQHRRTMEVESLRLAWFFEE